MFLISKKSMRAMIKFIKKTNEAISPRFILKCVLLLAIPLAITSCADIEKSSNKGYFGVGVPIALSPAKTKASLITQQEIVTKEASLETINPFETNQGHLRSSNQSQRAKIAFSPAGSGVPTVGNVTQNPAESATAIITPIQPEYRGLVMDGFTSLESYSAHKTDINEDFDLEVIRKGEVGDIYKVKFNISVNPLRQNYWSYIWRWLDFYNGFLNYTKDYHAEIDFEILPGHPGHPGRGEVVLVQPVNEGVNTFEMALMQKTSQLAGGATWQGVAAEIDLAERHREQFTQQRKNPILRGIVDSDTKFHFTISPRQYVAERTFRIPFFMSRYSIERGLDSGLQLPVSAYILVTNKNQDKLLIKVCGHYKKLGDPNKTADKDRYGIPCAVEPSACLSTNKPECKQLTIKLPQDKEPDPIVTVSRDHPNSIGITWGKRTITTNSSCATTSSNTAVAKLIYLDSRGGAALRHGTVNGVTHFWIETSRRAGSINNKDFALEFCSKKGDGTVIRKKSNFLKYITDNKYQSLVSIDGKPVEGAKKGQQVKISIYGIPGEKLTIKSVKFGNTRAVFGSKDTSRVNHIAEFNVIIPDVKDTQTLSIFATKRNRSSFLVVQAFKIE
jgi:hypothetical protein